MKRITMTLSPEDQWLELVEQAVLGFGRAADFSESLRRTLANSVLEACEELIRASATAGSMEPFTLSLEFKGEAVVAEIEYDGRARLNPHQAESYEVPYVGANIDEVDAKALWLHLIKQFMDRVVFEVRGSKRALRLIKYSREPGRERRAWVMALHPRLKQGLHLHLGNKESPHPTSVLQKPGGSVLRLGLSETFVVRRLDGKTSLHDIYMAHVDELGLIQPSVLSELYESLEAKGMLDIAGEDNSNSQWITTLRRLVNPNLSIPRADDFVTWAYVRLLFFFTPCGVGLLLAIGLSGAIPLGLSHEQFREVMGNLEETLIADPIILAPLYLLILLHALLHELAHGAACKRYGGMVPRLGVMFYLASFIFYCDTTAAWTFPLKRQRLLVSLAGPIVSFAVLGIGLWIAWALAGSGSLWESVFLAFSVFNFFGLAMNFNPLIKMDAYYMLVDITETPNLRVRSFRFLERRLLGWLGFGDDKALLTTLKERKVFWWYGLFGSAATVFFLILPLMRLVRLWRAESDTRGSVAFALLVCTLLMARLGTLAFLKAKALRSREYKLT